jgi:DNA-3-methyladenine glycosylase
MPIEREALAAPALVVAPTLLGATIRSDVGGQSITVRITEVEAYEGAADPASHAYRGPTKRNAVMYGEAGYLYCYFVYGMHWCANVVCGEPGSAAAVLLRAAEIVTGESAARSRTPSELPASKLASGPARLARCLGLTGLHTGLDLLDARSAVQLTELAPSLEFASGPRVGIAVAVDDPWRFWLAGEPSVSAYRRGGKRRLLQDRGQLE